MQTLPFSLRGYQDTLFKDSRSALVTYKRIIVQLPTGGGKTKIFIAISFSALAKGKTVLILTESKTIFEQIHKEANGIEINATSEKTLYIEPGRIYTAMVQTLAKRKLILEQFIKLGGNLLVINDEAHIGHATNVLLQLPDCLLLGFTATPAIRWAAHLPLLYNHCVCGPQVYDLINLGFLTSYRHYARIPPNISKLRIKNGEFTEESQNEVFNQPQVFNGIVEDLRLQTFRKCLIFCSSIDSAENLTEQLMGEGFNIVCYHSRQKKEERKYNKALFVHGDINICVSVGTLTKGFDFAKIDLIILRRATTSLPLYLQMCGRGSRIYPNKLFFVVLDYGENYRRHGMWDADRDWADLWRNEETRNEKAKGAFPVKNCPNCQAILPASTKECPYCKTSLETNPAGLRDGELIEITESYQQIIGKRLSELSPKELALFARLKNKKLFAIRISKAKEQEQKGWMKEFGKEMGYKPAWYYKNIPSESEGKLQFNDLVLK